MNIADNLVTTAERHPDAVALIQDETRLTYAELQGLSGPGRAPRCPGAPA